MYKVLLIITLLLAILNLFNIHLNLNIIKQSNENNVIIKDLEKKFTINNTEHFINDEKIIKNLYNQTEKIKISNLDRTEIKIKDLIDSLDSKDLIGLAIASSPNGEISQMEKNEKTNQLLQLQKKGQNITILIQEKINNTDDASLKSLLIQFKQVLQEYK